MESKKTIGILVEYNYEDLEVQYPKLRLKEAGHTVLLIGPVKGVKYTGKYGYPAVSSHSIDDIKAGILKLKV
jgi:protease I